MRRFLISRIMHVIPVLFIITIIVFVLVHVAGDPVVLMLPDSATQEDIARLRAALGLDQPFHIQYVTFLKHLMVGDFGTSFHYDLPALDIVLDRIPATLELTLASLLVAVIIAIPLGILSATKKDSIIDVFITGSSVLGKAMPSFWLGIMLIILLSVTFPIFPVSGSGTISHLVLPALTLGTALAADMTRLIRSSMLEILGQDFIKVALSKGLKEYIVILKHAFRNSLIPVITIIGLQMSQLVGGALVVETIFAWPGIGQLVVQAINGRDMAIVQAAIFVIAVMVILINLITDILYRVVDPRIDYK